MKLFLIILLAAVLRLFNLGDVPNGFHRDEAFLGYNAYSILKTGRDMNGDFLPLHLRSFIYSPGGYSYLAIPTIAVFGLNAFSVRLPAALFGIATVYITYLLSIELLKDKRLALLSSLLIAISPWHINLSRTATENVVVVFLIALGLYLYLRSRLLPAFVSLGLSMLFYQAPRAFLPLFIPFIFSKSKFFKKSILYLLLILVPIMLILLSPSLTLRLRTVGIPASGNVQLMLEEAIREDGVWGVYPLFSRMFHNKPFGFAGQFLGNYFSHWSYSFLFTDKGLPDRYRVPGAPLVYLIELPLLILGLIHLVNKKTWGSKLLLSWMIIAPIGSSLAFDDVPNLQRTLIIFPALSIIAAIGFEKIWAWRRIVALGYAVSLVVYLHSYWVHLPLHRPWFRHEGYKELVSEVQKRIGEYPSIVITNRETAPTVFFLFYSLYDPARFLTETRELPGDDRDRTSFDKYIFTTEECPVRESVENDPGLLYVNFGTCKDVPDTTILSTIRRGDGSAVFKLVVIDEQRKTREVRPVSESL